VDRYDTFLLDMWGVMHDGKQPYDGVVDTVQKLKEAGKDMIILSNSSKRKENSVKSLKKLGFEPAVFSQIITSGEVAHHLLSQTEGSPLAPKPWDALESVLKKQKKQVFCFGSGEGDAEYFENCGWSLASSDEADAIVARGTFTIDDGSSVIHKTHDGEDTYYRVYYEQLAKLAKRRLPMIVANPDKVRPDADRSPMPGTIGKAYEALLLKDGCDNVRDLVKYIGKPFPDVYEIALRGKDPARVCMVGDALETDVTGGSAFGVDTIWVVNDGIHNTEIQKQGNGDLRAGCSAILSEFNEIPETYAEGRKISPTIVLPHLRW